MSATEFWEKDPYLTVAYKEADVRNRQRTNFYLWLQGGYFHDAMAVVMQNAFAKPGSKAVRYLEEPYKITPPTEEEKQAAAEKERRKAIASLNAWKAAWDKVHG